MNTLLTGGASSAPAASTHLRCERFTGTDSLITGTSRRQLAVRLGFPDTQGAIPEARWVRAMTFERLVRQQPLASRFVWNALGPLGFEKPKGVASVVCGTASEGNDGKALGGTAQALFAAHARAVDEQQATLLHGLTVPFPFFDSPGVTTIRPDFAVVAPHEDSSVLLVGDAKDYERIRSRIDDARLLKGFLQVALGSLGAENWDGLPEGMVVSDHGVLAVPRNAFLQPEPKVENLTDHKAEAAARVSERVAQFGASGQVPDPEAHARHLEATFDPAACASCSLFRFCRSELRTKAVSGDNEALLVEIGVPEARRPALVSMLADGTTPESVPASLVQQVQATVSGTAQSTGLLRTDPWGEVGTVEAAIVKSDAAALGVHGIAVRRHTPQGPTDWDVRAFEDPQAHTTRRQVLRLLGRHIKGALADTAVTGTPDDDTSQLPVHLVVPDSPTEDVLVSIADNVAGVELARLRWQRDLDQGREPLTPDGEPASVPQKIRADERLAASFLLEADRSRALLLRTAVITAQSVLARHVAAGGPERSSLRLDYVLGWAKTLPNAGSGPAPEPLDPRAFEDAVEESERTPGAREVQSRSDELHAAQKNRAGSYESLVADSLAFKQRCLEEALDVLARFPVSALRGAYRAMEGSAQAVWRRRWHLEAGDLVRFGRVPAFWRNSQVRQIQEDDAAAARLTALTNPTAASDRAADPGNRDLISARVVEADPLVLETNSRRLAEDDVVQILHIDGLPVVESEDVKVKIQKGSIKLTGVPAGVLAEKQDRLRFRVDLRCSPTAPLAPGTELVLCSQGFLGDFSNLSHSAVKRPGVDGRGAPKGECTPGSYLQGPGEHQYCCKPHVVREAESSDFFAEERAAGRANPQAWPPVVDDDQFELPGAGQPTAETVPAPDGAAPPSDLSLSDID